MKKLIYLSLLTIGCVSYGQFNDFYNDELINSILIDTVIPDQWYKEKVNALASQIEEDKGQPEKMFPYVDYDSVLIYRINEKYRSTENSKYIEKVFVNGYINTKLSLKKGKKLTEKQVQMILDLVNNPLYFTWGECGTPIPFVLITFYLNTEIVALIQISCANKQIDCYPTNLRTKLGGIKPDHADRINYIIDQLD